MAKWHLEAPRGEVLDQAPQCYRDTMARRATTEAATTAMAQEALTRTEEGTRAYTDFYTPS